MNTNEPTMEANPMYDKYDEQVEPLLPCDQFVVANGIKRLCPCNYRSAVAAALREAGKREEELREDLNGISEELGLPPGIGPAEGWLKTQLENYKIALMERDDLRREVERLKNLIGIIQRESLNDLDLISKFNAEIAALKAEVDNLRTFAHKQRHPRFQDDCILCDLDKQISELERKAAQ